MFDVAIVGAGFTGLSAAWDFAKAGKKVVVFEAEADIGGLAGTFSPSPGVRLDKFYHHWFGSDLAVLDLIEELGLGDHIQRLSSRTGLYYANSTFRLSSPLDLLKFKAIPLLDRIRTGLLALYARKIENWMPLEDELAVDWLKRLGGKKAFEVMWSPLLKGKFGPEAEHISAVWMWNKLKLRGSSRGSKSKEELIYFKGSFGALSDGIRASLSKVGVEVRTSSPVTKVTVQNGVATGVSGPWGSVQAKQVMLTIPLPQIWALAPELPESYRKPAEQIRFLANVCVVLRLKKSLSETYWLNVADPTFPFVGVIEHTNLDTSNVYNGERIAYLSKYLSEKDPLFALSNEEYFAYCLPYLKRIFPEFSEDWLAGYHVWRARYSQPVVTKHYSKLIPATKTPISGLWLCTMAQVYPEDRGTNYAVRFGRATAKEMLKS